MEFFILLKIFLWFLVFKKEYGTSIFSGIIVLTNGLKNLSLLEASNFNIILASFLLGFGGISVMLQVYSVISKTDISIKPYFYGKTIQAIISGILTSVILFFMS